MKIVPGDRGPFREHTRLEHDEPSVGLADEVAQERRNVLATVQSVRAQFLVQAKNYKFSMFRKNFIKFYFKRFKYMNFWKKEVFKNCISYKEN